MRKLILNLILGISFFFISCENADNRINEGSDDGNVTNVVAKTNLSVGELHNIYIRQSV